MRDAQGAGSLDKLRELAADINSMEITGHLEVVGKFMLHTEWLDSWHKAFDATCEEIEAEIAERYMELPLDADGAPIRIGDKVEDATGGGPIEVMSLTYFEDCCDVNACGINPHLLRHVTPRTVEDVLEEYYDKRGWDEADNAALEADEITARYAAELRELMGGDA